ncbi:hypothetical protein I4U23_016343 [Adineta vaga]|nr:hypothetical protein I4U23_016343 [Adineta vaga]
MSACPKSYGISKALYSYEYMRSDTELNINQLKRLSMIDNCFTISLNGRDSIGKTTQLKYMPKNIEIRHDIHNYDELIKTNNLQEWWFEKSTHEEHVNVIMNAVNRRYNISNNNDVNFIVFDRGGITFEAICIATIAYKDKCNLKQAKHIYQSIIKNLGIKPIREDIRILLKYGDNVGNSLRKTYESFLHEQLQIQENENNYTHIIDVTGKSIIQIQNEIRSIINEYCHLKIENAFPLILQHVDLIIGFDEISKSERSSLIQDICDNLQQVHVTCVRLNIKYFMELISNSFGLNFYELSKEKQADELLKQLDHYLCQHSWINVLIIENLHSIEILKSLLGNKFYTKNLANESIHQIYDEIKSKIKNQSNITTNISAKKINLYSSEFVLSAGTVLIRKSTREICLLYVLNENNEWVLPKGRKNINEPLSEAAIRETYEETGYHCSLMPLTMQTRATLSDEHVEDIPREMNNICEPFFISVRPIKGDLTNRKLIFYYIAEVDEQKPREMNTQMINENFKVEFFSLNEAIRLLNFDEDKQLVLKAFHAFELTYGSFT